MKAFASFLILASMVVAGCVVMLFNWIFIIATLIIALVSYKYLEIEGEHHGEYYALLLFALSITAAYLVFDQIMALRRTPPATTQEPIWQMRSCASMFFKRRPWRARMRERAKASRFLSGSGPDAFPHC